MVQGTHPPADSEHPAVALQLLGGFELRIGNVPEHLPPSCQQLVALLATRGSAQPRAVLAGTLWPDLDERRAVANLRGVLWRLPAAVRARLRISGSHVGLSEGWSVDLARAAEAARRLRDGAVPTGIDHDAFHLDLLPGWYDSWLVDEQERYRQLRLHVLEQLARLHLEEGDAATAADLALAATLAEPLRESAQYLLIAAHLREGNRGMAARQLQRFRTRLRQELGVEPSAALTDLLGELAPH